MEPTIYKPSIYNGAGIYKAGAGGGGGGDKKYELDIDGHLYNFVLLAGLLISTEDSFIINDDVNGETYLDEDSIYYNYAQIQQLENYLNSNYPNVRIFNNSDAQTINAYLGNNTSLYLRSKTGWISSNGLDKFGLDFKPTGLLDAGKNIIDYGSSSLHRAGYGHNWLNASDPQFDAYGGHVDTEAYYMPVRFVLLGLD